MQGKNKRPLNEKEQQHGCWETYWRNGQLRWLRNYINGEHFGLSEWYDNDGILIKKRYYAT
jgi:antitoxin component YwqK of YwqJK toxin-antitoxin module